jgi:hypothetical protein
MNVGMQDWRNVGKRMRLSSDALTLKLSLSWNDLSGPSLTAVDQMGIEKQ